MVMIGLSMNKLGGRWLLTDLRVALRGDGPTGSRQARDLPMDLQEEPACPPRGSPYPFRVFAKGRAAGSPVTRRACGKRSPRSTRGGGFATEAVPDTVMPRTADGDRLRLLVEFTRRLPHTSDCSAQAAAPLHSRPNCGASDQRWWGPIQDSTTVSAVSYKEWTK